MVTNATTVVANLDAKALRERLDELEAERKAILVLLRAARAKERKGSANAKG